MPFSFLLPFFLTVCPLIEHLDPSMWKTVESLCATTSHKRPTPLGIIYQVHKNFSSHSPMVGNSSKQPLLGVYNFSLLIFNSCKCMTTLTIGLICIFMVCIIYAARSVVMSFHPVLSAFFLRKLTIRESSFKYMTRGGG